MRRSAASVSHTGIQQAFEQSSPAVDSFRRLTGYLIKGFASKQYGPCCDSPDLSYHADVMATHSCAHSCCQLCETYIVWKRLEAPGCRKPCSDAVQVIQSLPMCVMPPSGPWCPHTRAKLFAHSYCAVDQQMFHSVPVL